MAVQYCARRDDHVRAGTRVTQRDLEKLKEIIDGISVNLRCTNDPHVVQFIYREVIQLPVLRSSGRGSLSQRKLLDNLFCRCRQTSW